MFLLIACSSTKVGKIYWKGNLVETTDEVNYLFWKDGNQFLTRQKDSITVSLAGFELDHAVYVMASLTNDKSYPVTFFTNECKIQYTFNNQVINLDPVKPKNLDRNHLTIFNTILQSAGGISRLFLNIPVDLLFKMNTDESTTSGKINAEYHDEKSNMSKKIFMNTHTLFPGTNYTGFLVFEYDKAKSIKGNPFDLIIGTGTTFNVQGYFIE